MSVFRLAFFAIVISGWLVPPAVAEPSYALAMHGDPALPADFAHFPYVDPDAPKGGRINYGAQGSFDSLNPFIVQGNAVSGLVDPVLGNNVFESLMQRSADEPFTLYPLLAKTVETDAARTFVTFTLDPDAHFSDGQPVTPDDLIFTFELLRDKGYPRYATTAKKVATVEKVGERGVRFTFKDGDRELPLILGLLPVLPKHAIDPATFQKSSLKPLVGSGPYTVASVRPGDEIVLRRDPNYWARSKPSKIGFDNYDEIRIDYFRDANTLFEAFKKGEIDVLAETNAVRWATDYDFPAAVDGRVVKETFKTGLPSGMTGFVMNTRRAIFRDRATRAALALLFDFEWVNKNLFAGAYTRTRSFYQGSDLSSSGVPASAAEKALLASCPDAVGPDEMAGTYAPPVSDGTGRDRAFLKRGFEALKAAGFAMRDGAMVAPSGAPLAFEIMLKGANGQDIAMAWQRILEKLGIRITIRSVDDAQYQQRLLGRDYDVILQAYPASLSPGVEQVGRWGSGSRDAGGSYNFAGAADPALDAMIAALLKATTREDFVTAVRAFDRVLLSGAYLVPLYNQPARWIARWAGIQHPQVTPVYGPQFSTWWRKAS